MALHDSLRELVAARGAAVVDDATELRGALDDFLGEDEATIGELNLLVDAVRLGGLDRLLTMLDNGAAPAAAVAEAGVALARDRGSDDSRRAGWAVAALGFALGRVDAGVVERTVPTAGPVTPPPPPPPPPVPDPSPEPAPDALPGHGTVGSAEAVPTAFDRERSVALSPPPLPNQPVRRRKRRSVVLLAVSFAVVLGLAGGIGLALWLEREPTTSAGDDPQVPPTSEATDREGKQRDETVRPEDILLTYIGAADGKEYLYKVDAGGSGFEPLTDGGQDHLPSISPNRTQVAYLVGAAGEPRILKMLDIGSDGPRTVFEEGDCSYSQRPGWNPDGIHLALICTDEDSEPTGMYLADLEDNTPTKLFEPLSGMDGAPTWISDNTFVFTADHANGAPGGLWKFTVNMADPAQSAPPEELPYTDDSASLSHADWSEENQRLLFLVHPPGTKEFGELWVADENLQNPELIGEGYGHPVWSPDGGAIAFTMMEDGTEVLATAPYANGELGDAVPVDKVPEGDVGIPVWGSR